MKKYRVKFTKEQMDAFRFVGSVGGSTTASKYGPKHMGEIGRKGANSRWGRRKSSNNEYGENAEKR